MALLAGPPPPTETTASGADEHDPAAVAALLAELLTLEPERLVDAEVGDGMLALAKLRGQVDARLAELAATFDGRLLHTADATRSTASWLGARAELTTTDTRSIVERGRQLRSCPHVAAAYRAGILGTAKVRRLLTARDGVETQFAEHEAELVELIAPLVPSQAQVAVAAWRRLACATAGIEEDPEPFDESSNHLMCSPTFGGRYRIDGNLDPLAGAKLAAQLEAEIDHDFRSGTASRDDGCTAGQRRAKALGTIVDRGALETTRHGEPRPSVHLIWDVADLLGLPADTPAEALRRRCQLPDGTPIPRSVAERLLAEGTVRDILAVYGMDGSCQILGVSDRRRLPTARQRVALEHQQQACTIAPGCDQPTRWTESHHLDPFEHSQCTEIARMALACRHHHDLTHHSGFTLTTAADGTTILLRPDGTAIAPTPPGHQVHEPTAQDLDGIPTTDPPDRADLSPGWDRVPASGGDPAPPSQPVDRPETESPEPAAAPSRDAAQTTEAEDLPIPHQGFTVTRLRPPNPVPARTPSRFRTHADRRTETARLRARAATDHRALLAALFRDAVDERRSPAA